VDDDESFRVATQSLLLSLGYAVQSFESADQFLKSGLADTSACLISDIQMPVMDGLALQAELRARGNRLPIIFITAFFTPATEARAKKAGAVCVLTKPFDSDEFIRCLDDALKHASGGAG
jgi:FixJ family two-component response regulator